jgi:hypothetical protein
MAAMSSIHEKKLAKKRTETPSLLVDEESQTESIVM